MALPALAPFGRKALGLGLGLEALGSIGMHPLEATTCPPSPVESWVRQLQRPGLRVP